MNNSKTGKMFDPLNENEKIDKIKIIQSLPEKIVLDFLSSKGSLKKDFLKKIINV